MSIEALIVVALASGLALLTLVGALVLRRLVGHASAELVRVDEMLTARAVTIGDDLVTMRGRLVTTTRADTERLLWSLAQIDANIEAAATALRERRAASDTLRATLMHNRDALVRVTNGARVLIRAIELRREFLA